MPEHKLIDIPADKWPELRDLYLQNWPNNMVGYYTIDNYVKWSEKQAIIDDLHIYSLDDCWKDDGTFLIVDRYQLILNSLDATNEHLKTALSLLDWNRGYLISAFLSRHYDTVIGILDANGVPKNNSGTPTPIYYLPLVKAQQVKVVPPEGITLRTMTQDEAAIADSVWPNRRDGTLFLLKRLAAWNPNVAAINANGKMLAWCFRLQAGPLGALQVHDEHKRQGLGTIVLRAMVEQLANRNMDVFACINADNVASIKMFENVGFEYMEGAYWLTSYAAPT